MAWITFNSIEEEKGRISRAGKPYDCFVLRGTKEGFPQGVGEDTPYEKILFSNSGVTVIENGVARPNMSMVQFLQYGCKPGDRLNIKQRRVGAGKWELDTVENMTENGGRGTVNKYVPLSSLPIEEVALLRAQQMPATYDPTRPAAPATPQMAPLNYTPAV